MSLSNPNNCRIDTFMSGSAASVAAVIDPPGPRVPPRRESADRCGSDVEGNLAESAWPAEALRRDPRAAKNGYQPDHLYRCAEAVPQPPPRPADVHFLFVDQCPMNFS